MKKYRMIFMTLVALCSAGVANAQVEDVDPLLKYKNHETGLKITAGARFMSDFGYFHSDLTPLKSGAAITDMRLRTSLTYDKFYFYADVDFSKGIFKQKNVFVRYNIAENTNGIHSLKGGYFADPASMSYNTSLYSYHFISRPAAVNALAPGRALGVTYKYYNTKTLLDQGLFSENKYNDQAAGYQGYTVSGRWLYKAINHSDMTLHIGASARYARIETGKLENGIFKTSQTIESSMQTYLDPTTRFLSAELPWARSNFNVEGELLVRTNKFFARGEYLYKKVYKERPDEQIFTNQLGGLWSWGSLQSWKNGNPLRSNTFQGAYVEMGWLASGNRYTYDDEYGQLKGMNDKNSLEIVGRYSYTNLNDINSGDLFLIGNKKFYPNGVVSDYPVSATSVGGGKLHAVTIGVNYAVSQYLKFMGEYQYAKLDNIYYPGDKDFHTVQMRVMFAF